MRVRSGSKGVMKALVPEIAYDPMRRFAWFTPLPKTTISTRFNCCQIAISLAAISILLVASSQDRTWK